MLPNDAPGAAAGPTASDLARRLGRSIAWAGGSALGWLIVQMLLLHTWPAAPESGRLHFALGCLSAGAAQGLVWRKSLGTLDFQAPWATGGHSPWLFVLTCVWYCVVVFLLLAAGLLLALCVVLLPHYGENPGWN